MRSSTIMTQLYRLYGSDWSCFAPTKSVHSGWILCCNMRQQLLTSASSFRRVSTGAHGPLAHRGLLWPPRPPGEEAPLHPRAVGLRAGPPASGPPARHHLGDLNRRPAGRPPLSGPACSAGSCGSTAVPQFRGEHLHPADAVADHQPAAVGLEHRPARQPTILGAGILLNCLPHRKVGRLRSWPRR
jgi:hypothetical protein